MAITDTKKKTEAEKDKRARKQVETVEKLLETMEKKLTGKEAKATLGDYIKLIQLQKELEQNTTREIKVTWVDPETEANPESGNEE